MVREDLDALVELVKFNRRLAQTEPLRSILSGQVKFYETAITFSLLSCDQRVMYTQVQVSGQTIRSLVRAGIDERRNERIEAHIPLFILTSDWLKSSISTTFRAYAACRVCERQISQVYHQIRSVLVLCCRSKTEALSIPASRCVRYLLLTGGIVYQRPYRSTELQTSELSTSPLYLFMLAVTQCVSSICNPECS